MARWKGDEDAALAALKVALADALRRFAKDFGADFSERPSEERPNELGDLTFRLEPCRSEGTLPVDVYVESCWTVHVAFADDEGWVEVFTGSDLDDLGVDLVMEAVRIPAEGRVRRDTWTHKSRGTVGGSQVFYEPRPGRRWVPSGGSVPWTAGLTHTRATKYYEPWLPADDDA